MDSPRINGMRPILQAYAFCGNSNPLNKKKAEWANMSNFCQYLGRWFTLSSFFGKFSKKLKIFRQLNFFTKDGLGRILGDIVDTNSSGHPGRMPPLMTPTTLGHDSCIEILYVS
jgi:hypothetical protein